MIIECKSRKEAREQAAKTGGKVKDNGVDAATRWTVVLETKTAIVATAAAEFGAEVVNQPLVDVEPADLKGVPPVREVLSINSTKTYFNTEPSLMRRRGQGKQVEVYTRKQYQSRLA